MARTRFSRMVSVLILAGLLFGAVFTARPAAEASTRMGAWVDSVLMTASTSDAEGVSKLAADELDIYADPVADPALFAAVTGNPALEYSTTLGSYFELTLNPYGPNFNDGRLNPFHNAKIREALNWLVDRDHLINNILSGLGLAKLLPITTSMIEYTRYIDKAKELEAAYAYDLNRANQVIATEMAALGATLVSGKWSYGGSPITLIFLIRTEDSRRVIGDYVANQLESVGFTVDRQYKNSSEARTIWVDGDPAEGLFHIYTGGWVANAISRDETSVFDFFYTPDGYSIALWQTYTPSPEFDDLATRLLNWDFADMAERATLFERAMELSMDDPGAGSLHIWLVQLKSFYPRQADTSIASDLMGGYFKELWPYTIRFDGMEGGQVRLAQAGILKEPWNPLGGSNWLYDQTAILATQDAGLLPDPNDGLLWPQRISQAEVVAQTGLPVFKTLDWVSLSYADLIPVPGDAWVDWDATNQRFITAAEKYPDGTDALVKSTVTYPSDLFSIVKWHDGSPLDLSDFVMKMILTFDPGKPESAIYDPELASAVDDYLAHFKGVRIISTDPLVIETYEDRYSPDAEWNVHTWWPNYAHGPGAWHNLAIGIRAVAAGELAFTQETASNLGVPWANYLIDGQSNPIMESYLFLLQAENYIPYLPTLGAYITNSEATARWSKIWSWWNIYGHFWIGSGPFFFVYGPTGSNELKLARFTSFPDPAGKWDAFVANPALSLNYDSGAPGSYLTLSGTGFPGGTTEFITVNGQNLAIFPVSPTGGGAPGLAGKDTIQVATSANGSFTLILATNQAEEGDYQIATLYSPVEPLWFSLDDELPVHPQEGSGEVVDLPADSAYKWLNFLPVVNRNY